MLVMNDVGEKLHWWTKENGRGTITRRWHMHEK